MEPKTPKESLNLSTIQKYLVTKEVSPNSLDTEKKQQGVKEKKKVVVKQKRGSGDKASEDTGREMDLNISKMAEQRNESQIPSKIEMMEVFAKLEISIKN